MVSHDPSGGIKDLFPCAATFCIPGGSRGKQSVICTAHGLNRGLRSNRHGDRALKRPGQREQLAKWLIGDPATGTVTVGQPFGVAHTRSKVSRLERVGQIVEGTLEACPTGVACTARRERGHLQQALGTRDNLIAMIARHGCGRLTAGHATRSQPVGPL